jgi:hypothetical protein
MLPHLKQQILGAEEFGLTGFHGCNKSSDRLSLEPNAGNAKVVKRPTQRAGVQIDTHADLRYRHGGTTASA